MKKPNFFILGAPKCGTTSLASWLANHPHVYLSRVKEPHYFNTDMNNILTPTLNDYETLFLDSGPEHVAVGEASVWYLYSREAVPNILDYIPDSRFIVCLRNPIDMAQSLHGQCVVSGIEDVSDFARAWELQWERQRGNRIPRFCREPSLLLYGQACSTGTQLKRLYDQVDKERILPILFDDMASSPRREYLRALDFLGVSDDLRTEFPVVNAARAIRSKMVQQAMLKAGEFKLRLGIRNRLGIDRLLTRINTRMHRRRPLDVATHQALVSYFQPEVRLLSGMLDRDLDHWLDRRLGD